MFIKKLFLVCVLSSIIPAQASDIVNFESSTDVILLEDISIFNEVDSSDINYKKSLEQKYQKQKNKNLYNLKNTLIQHPEFSDVINPLISYLESNKTFEDAENNIPNLLIEIAKDSK
ncbi:MAG: hypothetical protein K2X69_17090 [Silvanigrellaceae bacterium]|nr:hypothetical protein [Silvanigrellaceae bacterium]